MSESGGNERTLSMIEISFSDGVNCFMIFNEPLPASEELKRWRR